MQNTALRKFLRWLDEKRASRGDSPQRRPPAGEPCAGDGKGECGTNEPMTNALAQKLIHKTLGPMMKREGFLRKGRAYYKQMGDLIFILKTEAVGAYFSSVSNWPSHAFAVYDGIWIDGISPGVLGRYPKRTDGGGCYIPEGWNCVHINHKGDPLRYGIRRQAEHPYLESAARYGVTSLPEQKRNDLWVMPEEPEEQAALLRELAEQVQRLFLDRYQQYLAPEQLKTLVVDLPYAFNVRRGYVEGAPFAKGKLLGNMAHYLNYATLFYQKYGPEEQYRYFLGRYEEWAAARGETVAGCYYCGYGRPFRLGGPA